jgi:hypothetical protein
MSEASPAALRIAVGHIATLAKVLAFAGALSVAVVIARLFGLKDVGPLAVGTPLGYIWIAFIAITCAHWFLAFTAVESFDDALDRAPKETPAGPVVVVSGERLYQEIRSQDTWVLRGLCARVPTNDARVHWMSWRDPTTIIFLGLAALSFTAIVPWRVTDGDLEWSSRLGGVIGSLILACLLLGLNWAAGGHWTIALSQLRMERQEDADRDRGGVSCALPVGNERGCLVALVVVLLLLAGIPWFLVDVL